MPPAYGLGSASTFVHSHKPFAVKLVRQADAGAHPLGQHESVREGQEHRGRLCDATKFGLEFGALNTIARILKFPGRAVGNAPGIRIPGAGFLGG
jgi:hypothetical protein